MVALSGSGSAVVGGQSFPLSRRGVFEAASDLLYVPPGSEVEFTAFSDWTVALGRAPAEGRYPVRLITSDGHAY